MKTWDACSTKSRYATKQQARSAARFMGERSRERLSYYGCPLCGGFHLTKHAHRAHTDRKRRKEAVWL